MRPNLIIDVEHLVREEVRAIGEVDGYGSDDLAQEGRLAAHRALSRLDVEYYGPRRAYTYVRTAVHNALVTTKRNAHVHSRVPRNGWGRRVAVESLDAPSALAERDGGEQDSYAIVAGEDDPETTIAARELLRALEERLDAQERESLFRVIEEGVDVLRARARGIPKSLRVVQEKAERVIGRLLRTPDLLEMDERADRILRGHVHRVDDGAHPTKGPFEKEHMTMGTAKQKKIDLPAADFEKVSCHGANPNEQDRIGYAPPSDPDGHAGCVNCNDKFSCVQASITNSLVDGLTLDTDREVAAVLRGDVALDTVLARLRERRQIKKAGGTPPHHLLMESFGEEPEAEEEEAAVEETEEATAEEEATEEVASDESGDDGEEAADDASEETEATETESANEESTTMTTTTTETAKAAKKGSKKAASKPAPAKANGKANGHSTNGAAKAAATKETAKAAKKAPTKKAASKPAPAAARPRIPADKRVAIDLPGGARYLPQPRELTPDQMTAALSKVALGQPFDLAVGMQLVRKLRDGSETVVSIKKNGFEYNGAVYPSLTAAAMHATGRSVNGNTHFSVEANSCTEIRGSGVPGGRFSKDGGATTPSAPKKAPSKPAAAPAKAAPKKAEKPAKAAKKAPAKAAAKKAPSKKAPPPPPPAKKSSKKK